MSGAVRNCSSGFVMLVGRGVSLDELHGLDRLDVSRAQFVTDQPASSPVAPSPNA